MTALMWADFSRAIRRHTPSWRYITEYDTVRETPASTCGQDHVTSDTFPLQAVTVAQHLLTSCDCTN